jgi:AAA family ATP:ADP antiporter
MKRPSHFVSRVLGIQPGETGIAWAFFFYFFLITAPFYIIKPIRDASFLDELGSRNLPWAYATALVVGLVVAFHSKIQARLSRSALIAGSLVFFVLTSLIFWALFPSGGKWLPLAFWMWANILAVVLVTQFWIVVNDAFTPREAKRLIGFFGSGGILGGIAGALFTALMAGPGSGARLLLPAAVVLAATLIPAGAIFRHLGRERGRDERTRPEEKTIEKAGFKDCFDTVRGDSYLRLLAAVVLITGVISTFADWQSKNIIERWPQARANLTSFFGYFNLGLLAFSFLLQFMLTSNIIERYGLRLTLLFYPTLLLLCSLGIIFWPGIVLAVGIKGADKSLSYSINQSSRELLYIPVSPERKYRAKVFIDMFLNRFSKSIGAVILLGLILLPVHPPLTVVSLAAAAFIGVWIALNRKISRAYLELLRSKLERRWGRGEALVAERVDVGSAKLVFDMLESRERSPVLYAQHLFELLAENRLTPEVRAFLASQRDGARIPSLGSLIESESAGWVPELDRPEEKEALKTDIAEIFRLDVYQEVMKDYIDKVMAHPEDVVSRMEVAKFLGWVDRRSPLIGVIDDLLADSHPDVVRYAIESAARLGRREDVPFLIDRLSDPALAEDAQAALERFGPRITGTLFDALADDGRNSAIRGAAAAILAAVGGQAAADYLLWELDRAEEKISTEVLDALDRLRSAEPGLIFSGDTVRRSFAREVRSYYQAYLGAAKVEAVAREGGAGRSAAFDARLRRLFLHLGLIFLREDIQRAYQNLQVGTRFAVAYVLELLDNLLPRDLKEALFPIIEDLPEAERVHRFRTLLETGEAPPQ